MKNGPFECLRCDGLGEWDEGPLPARSSTQIDPEYRRVICPDCNGDGRIDETARLEQIEELGDPRTPEFGVGGL